MHMRMPQGVTHIPARVTGGDYVADESGEFECHEQDVQGCLEAGCNMANLMEEMHTASFDDAKQEENIEGAASAGAADPGAGDEYIE